MATPGSVQLVIGVVAVAAFAYVAQLLGSLVPAISGVVFALVIGAVLGNAFNAPGWLRQGGSFASKKLLRLAIILLGSSLSLGQIASIGGKSLVVIVVTIYIQRHRGDRVSAAGQGPGPH